MTLLCIDDDPDDVDIFCEALQEVEPSATCVVARNGKDALDILNTLKPDMIVLDINMPIMNGPQTLRHIRANKGLNAIPVCMLSTHIEPKEAITYRQMGATDCLIKPRSFSAFCQMVQNLLRTRGQPCL